MNSTILKVHAYFSRTKISKPFNISNLQKIKYVHKYAFLSEKILVSGRSIKIMQLGHIELTFSIFDFAQKKPTMFA